MALPQKKTTKMKPKQEKKKTKKKLNCWEYFECGREPEGKNVEKEGVCPSPIETSLDGLHGGENAGRVCWAVAMKDCCVYRNDGSYIQKMKDCISCDFHQLVIREEGENYENTISYLKKVEKEQERIARIEEKKLHKEPGLFEHLLERSKRTAEDNLEVESLFISFIIAWTSFCPSISIMEASKRLCKDDLIDELMVIDAIADNPRTRALRIYFKTVFKAIRRNVEGYFKPLLPSNDKKIIR